MIFAISLTLILLLAALGVDLGNISQTKEHSVTAAQDAALSAVPDLALIPSGPPYTVGTQEAAAVNDVEKYVVANYPSAAGEFDTCGIYPLPVPTYSNTNCIGFFSPSGSSSPTAIAVEVPPQAIGFTLGKAGGQTPAQVSAIAYASVKTASGYTLPFSYPTTGGTGLECLATGSSAATSALCTGFSTGSGNFGLINSPRYSIFAGSSTKTNDNPVIQMDLALGLDHPLQSTATATPQICDANGTPPKCDSYNNVAPYNNGNYVSPETAVDNGEMGPGLFIGVKAQKTGPPPCDLRPRLNHYDGFIAVSADCTADNPTQGPSEPLLDLTTDNFGSSYQLNGVQISYYLNPIGQTDANTCSSLLPSGDTAANTPVDAGMITDKHGNITTAWSSYDTCFSGVLSGLAAGGSPAPIFLPNIEQSPRFGLIPVVVPATGINPEQITGFLGAYLDIASGSTSPTHVDSIRSWIFPLSMIQPSESTGAGIDGYSGGAYVATLCSYEAGNC